MKRLSSAKCPLIRRWSFSLGLLRRPRWISARALGKPCTRPTRRTEWRFPGGFGWFGCHWCWDEKIFLEIFGRLGEDANLWVYRRDSRLKSSWHFSWISLLHLLTTEPLKPMERYTVTTSFRPPKEKFFANCRFFVFIPRTSNCPVFLDVSVAAVCPRG